MKSNQKGFSVIEILLVIVVVGLIGTVGWLVYDRQNDSQDTTDTSNSQTNPENSEESQDTAEDTSSKVDTTIHEVDIKLQTTDDISKLPEYTPESFKAYMLDILKDNKFYFNNIDGVNTITQYQISKISQVNIVGGQVPVDKDGEGHAGGAPAIWVLTPSGTWDRETLNGPVCKSENGGLIYEEFVPECFTDPNTDSWTKNPNGSIKSLAL